jgi:hypothetical protein
MYTSSKQVLAGYIMKIRGERQGELLAKQQGEIQLLLYLNSREKCSCRYLPTPVAQQARASALLTQPAAVSPYCNRQAAAARGRAQ